MTLIVFISKTSLWTASCSFIIEACSHFMDPTLFQISCRILMRVILVHWIISSSSGVIVFVCSFLFMFAISSVWYSFVTCSWMIDGVAGHGWSVGWLGEQARSQPISWELLNAWMCRFQLWAPKSHTGCHSFPAWVLELLKLKSDALSFQQSEEHLHLSDLLAFLFPNASNLFTSFINLLPSPPFLFLIATLSSQC